MGCRALRLQPQEGRDAGDCRKQVLWYSGALLDEHEAPWQAQAAAAAPPGAWVSQDAHAASAAAYAPQSLAQSGPGRPALHPYGAALAAGVPGHRDQFTAPSLGRWAAAGSSGAADPITDPVTGTAVAAPGEVAALMDRGRLAQQDGQVPASVAAAPALAGIYPSGIVNPAAAPGMPGSTPFSSVGALPPPLRPAQAVLSLGQGVAAASSGQHGAAQPAASSGAGPWPGCELHAAPGGTLQQAQPAGAVPGFYQGAAPGVYQTGGQQQ